MNTTRTFEDTRPIALAVGGAIALGSAMGIGRFAYTPILPEMVAALHLTASEAGLIASANFAGYLIGALAAAAHFFGPRRRGWMLAALLVSALTTGAMAATSSLAVFVLLRFLGGFASAFALVFTSSLVLDRLAAGRSHMAGHQFAGVGAGIAISAILVAQLAARNVAWQWQWIATAVLSLLAVLAVAALIPARRDGGSVAAANGKDGIGSALAALILAYGLFGFGYVITATFLVQLVRTSPEIAPLEPFIWVIVGFAGMPSVAIWAAIGRRIGVGHGYALACLVEAAGVLSSVLWNAPAGAILAAVLLGGTFVGITVLGLVGARRLAAGAASRIIGLMTASFGLGQIIGPIFAGWVHDMTGTFLMPSVAAAGALVMAALLVWRVSAAALR